MDQAIIKAAAAIGAGLCMGLALSARAVGEGNAVGKALEGMARQPEVSDTLRTNMTSAAPSPSPPVSTLWSSLCCCSSFSDAAQHHEIAGERRDAA